MTARKLGHFKFLNETTKKPMVERRKVGLFKKARELSVLCDVEVGIVMFPQDQRDPIVWPSMEVVTHRFTEFLSLPESEKAKKMVTHEKYLRDRIEAEVEKIKKKEMENEKKEMNILMKQILDGRSLNEMDARQLKGLYIIAGEKMQELEKRRRDLQLKEGGNTTTTAAASPYHGPCLQLINNYSFTDSINTNNGSDGSVTGKDAGGSSGGSGGCHQLVNNYPFAGSTSTHPNNGENNDNVIEKEGSGSGNSGGSNIIGKEGGSGGGSNDGGSLEPITNYSHIGSPSTNTNNGGDDGVTRNEGGGFPNMELPNATTTTTSDSSPSPHTFNQVWPYNFFSS